MGHTYVLYLIDLLTVIVLQCLIGPVAVPRDRTINEVLVDHQVHFVLTALENDLGGLS
jgi:hypothetical protein